MPQQRAVGIDFGTSNTALAVLDAAGKPRFAEFPLLGQTTSAFRSLLFFDPEEQSPGDPLEYCAGPQAIESYLENFGEGRLIQSFKTHLSTQLLGRTQIAHHHLDLDGMVALFFRRLQERCRHQLGQAITHAVVGRPVTFAGASQESDNERAQQRIRDAALRAGFSEVQFELEPIAAAHHYERSQTDDQVVLIADFGGGTTDYCLMQIGPSFRDLADRHEHILATGGVGVAGDDLDARIIEHAISPALGMGTSYREFGKRHEIPSSYYRKLSRWHQLSFLRGKETLLELDRLHQFAERPERLAAFISLVTHNRGFYLHKSVEAAKLALSRDTQTILHYADEDANFQLERKITRADFEAWIAPEVTAIAQSLDETLARANLAPESISQVFLTGGTAFVPAVRKLFSDRFGDSRLRGGDEMLSIASGLAYRANHIF